MDISEYVNGLDEKIKNPPKPEIVDSLCCWSDLLGFGSPISKCGWEPNENMFQEIYKRILNAQSVIFKNIVPTNENALILNDGLVRCLNLKTIDHIDLVSLWIRSCIFTHCQINESELKLSLPGTRTVLTHGKQLIHNHASINFDDFVYNYTKKNPGEMSSLAKENGNPVIASNPSFLQLNLAFSKAYILDSYGSSIGLKGNSFFIQEEFLNFLVEFGLELNSDQRLIREDNGSYELFALPSRDDNARYHLGFELEKPVIEVDTRLLKTKIWKVRSFFPWDEDIADFKIEIESFTT